MGDPWTDLSGMRKRQLNPRQQCAPERWIIVKGPSEEKSQAIVGKETVNLEAKRQAIERTRIRL